MSLKTIKTSIPGVLLIEPQAYEDSRGYFMEVFRSDNYAKIGINQTFVQDNYSHTRKGIIRGLHYQLCHPQGKLVFVITGEIFDVAVDIRRGSSTFGKWFGAKISAENKRQMFIPEGFAHGFCVLSETADVFYKCTGFYDHGDEYGVLWSDADIGIDWPITPPALSDKDNLLQKIADIPEINLPTVKP